MHTMYVYAFLWENKHFLGEARVVYLLLRIIAKLVWKEFFIDLLIITPVFIRYFGVFKSKELIKLFSMQFINVAWTRIQVIVNQIHFLLYHM